MTKKTLIIAMVAGLLAVAALGGAALAQTDDADGTSFAGRLAAKLGLAESTVQTAIDEVREEMRQEKIDAALEAMVEKGKITQEQADEYRAWLESAPDGLQPFPGRGGFGRGKRGHHWFGGDKPSWFRGGERPNDTPAAEGVSS